MYKFLLLFLIFIYSTNVNATHLVGGEMNYRYLGEDLYEITLTVYRDCYLGVPDFDLPAYILVYNSTGFFEGAFNINGSPKVSLPVILDDECFSAPPNVCVEKKEYRFRAQLPDNGQGYYISYQRCCRNATILNIFDDLSNNVEDSGMNLYAFIPSPTKVNNSNPVFKNFPPVAICVNKPLVFDHSATDFEGDSLVYKLCTPTDALSPDDPAVNSNNYDAIPFRDVRWRNPYSLDNMLGGDTPMTIDPKSGLLTAYPNKIGQYVVGVCVEEYRNNVLVGETKRDFQFNVAQCGKISVASFFTFDTICNSLSVPFQNQSVSATNFLWDFGDGTTSTLKEPTHKFERYGSYTVTLIASSDVGCADTSTQTIFLTEDNFSFNKEDVSICRGEEATLKIQASISEIQYVKWGVNPPVYNQNLQHVYIPLENQTIPVEVKTKKGCTYTQNITVSLNDVPNVNLTANPKEIKGATMVDLVTNANANYDYEWIFEQGQSNGNQNSVSVFMDKSQWVKVKVTNKNTGCSRIDSVYIERVKCSLDPYYKIDSSATFSCDGVVFKHLLVLSQEDIEYFWLYQNENYEDLNFNVNIPYNTPVSYSLVLSLQDECVDTIVFNKIFNKPIPVISNTAYTVCKEDTSVWVNLNVDYSGDYSIVIDGVEDILINESSFTLDLNGSDIMIPFAVLYGDSCKVQDQIKVQISSIQVQASAQPTVVEPGGEVELTVSPQNYEIYQWSPDSNLTQPNASSTLAIVYENTEFIVLAENQYGCISYDTVFVEVKDLSCDYESMFIPTAFTPNGDGVNDTWMVRTRGEVTIELKIFNRWGEKVFESNDVQNTWDGTFKDNKAEVGSYAYYLTITCEGMTPYFTKGNITLIR